ncbi:PilZ domain-containing protein [uncultured Desulfosarcina sp.]|uniref:PilZ domain-containing protein n=1 Tax=uncultured Desulfosarcina sp. TaxID=218289 RepID=UPI0029C85DBB|nr:PilZ domain-containing protein [uncultured Desulfosarcina sp.]
MERANLYPDEIQAETAVGSEERQRLATHPAPPPKVETERTAKTIGLGQLINKLNHLNFVDKPLFVNFRHKRYPRMLSIKASPQPCQDEHLACLWQQDPGSIVEHPDLFNFENIIIPDGKRFLVVEPEMLEVDERAIRFVLPETCSAADTRSTRRRRCQGVHVYVTQNGALYYGSMIDFSAFSFRVQVQTTPPQTFEWIDADSPVDVILFDGSKTLYSGGCRITKQTHGYKDRHWVLEPIKRNKQRFRPKEFRSKRRQLVPLPTISFSHPFSKQTVNLNVLNLSGSGLAVEEEAGQAVLFPGLIIPELEIRFGDGSYATCTAQIIYSRDKDDNLAEDMLKCGIAFLDMPIEDHIKILALLQQVDNKNAHVCNRVDLDALWNFFFETGFIYPGKYEFIEKNKAQIKRTYNKLYSENPKIARHFIYQKRGQILGHVAMLRFYQRTWLIHHHAAIRSALNKSGLVVLHQIGQFANDSHRLDSLHMQYLACFYQPTNKFPSRVFGGARQSINNDEACSTEPFAYFHHQSSPSKHAYLPAGWSLRPSSDEDLLILQNVYQKTPAELMLRAMGLDVEEATFADLADTYREIGLIRQRHLFTLERNCELKAVIMINLSDLGLNMSDLTNCITVFVLNRSGLNADIVHCVCANLAKQFNRTYLPVLLHPAADAAALNITAEKEYIFWALNTNYGDDYFRYIKRLTKFVQH